ncbi:MAG: hypothetical protein LUE24_15505 [Lachnospiraceae bacterium]|nr:hypothetical protein [Lachnospiraceae bacterium]
MEIKLEQLLAQKRELERYADELQETKVRLIKHQAELRTVWNAREMDDLGDVIDRLSSRARQMAVEIEDIGHAMLQAYEELQEEEE